MWKLDDLQNVADKIKINCYLPERAVRLFHCCEGRNGALQHVRRRLYRIAIVSFFCRSNANELRRYVASISPQTCRMLHAC